MTMLFISSNQFFNGHSQWRYVIEFNNNHNRNKSIEQQQHTWSELLQLFAKHNDNVMVLIWPVTLFEIIFQIEFDAISR